jgi:hypothetical protein
MPAMTRASNTDFILIPYKQAEHGHLNIPQRDIYSEYKFRSTFQNDWAVEINNARRIGLDRGSYNLVEVYSTFDVTNNRPAGLVDFPPTMGVLGELAPDVPLISSIYPDAYKPLVELNPRGTYFEPRNIFLVRDDGTEIKISQHNFFREYIQNKKLRGNYLVHTYQNGGRQPIVSAGFDALYQNSRNSSLMIYEVNNVSNNGN